MSAPNPKSKLSRRDLSRRDLSRRDFLKIAAATTAGFLAGSVYPVYATETSAEGTWGMLIDLTRCTGCNSCALACKESNNLPQADVVPDSLESDAFTFVDARKVVTVNGETELRYVKRQCMHCLNAACASACPAAAMHSSGEGPVVYRPNRCLGRRYCQVACPFEVPRFDWDNGVNPVISKCWLCYDRLQAGQQPACAEACPTGTLRFGQREELLTQAHAQIASNPGRYVDHVFGESEVGGTSMLYISDVPFDRLGFPTGLPQTAPPEETEKIMSKLPFVIGGMAAVMTGTAVYTHRGSIKSIESDRTAEQNVPSHLTDDQEK